MANLDHRKPDFNPRRNKKVSKGLVWGPKRSPREEFARGVLVTTWERKNFDRSYQSARFTRFERPARNSVREGFIVFRGVVNTPANGNHWLQYSPLTNVVVSVLSYGYYGA